jgi:hypothetical protein
MFPCAPGSTHAVLGCLSGFSWNTDRVRTEGPIVIDRQQPLSCGVNGELTINPYCDPAIPFLDYFAELVTDS